MASNQWLAAKVALESAALAMRGLPNGIFGMSICEAMQDKFARRGAAQRRYTVKLRYHEAHILRDIALRMRVEDVYMKTLIQGLADKLDELIINYRP